MSRQQDAPSDGPIGATVEEAHHGHGAHDRGGGVELPPGWSRPKPEHVPRPTYWPSVAALGITFLFWGFVTTWIISVIGLILFALGLAGWIGALRHGE